MITVDFDNTITILAMDEDFDFHVVGIRDWVVDQIRDWVLQGEEVAIVTSRFEKGDNSDLFAVLAKLGLNIPVHFCNGKKASTLNRICSVLHLDDDPHEALGAECFTILVV